MDIVKRITEPIKISNPKNGKLLNEAVTPNNPRNAGNNQTKQLGQAPPRRPPNTPIKPKLDVLFTPFNSLNFI